MSLSITRLNRAPRIGLPLDDDRTMECWNRPQSSFVRISDEQLCSRRVSSYLARQSMRLKGSRSGSARRQWQRAVHSVRWAEACERPRYVYF